MDRVPHDRQTIELFVKHLRDRGRPELKVDRWPEEDQPGSSQIDAIAGDLAIEHTSIDTVPEQRRDSNRFEEALGAMETLGVGLTFRLSIVVPYELITVGTDWVGLRRDLEAWITDTAPVVPDGAHEVSLSGTILRCTALKESGRAPGLFMSRPAQVDGTLGSRIGGLVRRKLKKLTPYKARGYMTVILLESSDLSLMNQYKMLEAARNGISGSLPAGLDQVWYAEMPRGLAPHFFDFTSALVNHHDKLS